MTRFGALSVPNPDPPLMTISIRCVYNIPAASWVKIGGGELCGSVRPESGRIRGKQHPASEKGYKRSRHPLVSARGSACCPVKRSGRGGGGARWGRFDTRVAGADVEPGVAVVHFSGPAGSPVRKEGRGGVPHLVLRHVPPERGATGVLLHQLAEIAHAGGGQRTDRPRRDGVDADPFRPEIVGQVTGRRFEGGLGHTHHVVVRNGAHRPEG